MSKQDLTADKNAGVPGLIARIFWMLIGNTILVISIVSIFQNKGGFFHTADMVFWITAAALVIVRYLDVKFLNGLTATDLPATMAHWRRYSMFLLICSAAAWTLAHTAALF